MTASTIQTIDTPPTVYYFGRAVTRYFTPSLNEQALQLPTQTPHIYLFDSEPTRAVAAAGTGALQSKTTWTVGVETPYPCTYSFDAITDPDATSDSRNYLYWESLNFILETSGEVQTIIRSFAVTRAAGGYDSVDTTTEDLAKIFTAAASYFSVEAMEDHIALAVSALQVDLLAKGWRWADVGELRFARYAVAYKALSTLCFGRMVDPGDRFDKRSETYGAEYENLIKKIPLRADKDRDGKPESAPQMTDGFLLARR